MNKSAAALNISATDFYRFIALFKTWMHHMDCTNNTPLTTSKQTSFTKWQKVELNWKMNIHTKEYKKQCSANESICTINLVFLQYRKCCRIYSQSHFCSISLCFLLLRSFDISVFFQITACSKMRTNNEENVISLVFVYTKEAFVCMKHGFTWWKHAVEEDGIETFK